jgi:hypothetical protein
MTTSNVSLALVTAALVGAALWIGPRTSQPLANNPTPNDAATQQDDRAQVPEGGAGQRVLNIVRQGFPAAKADPRDLSKSDTAWEIEWDLTHPLNRPRSSPGCVLRIRSAKFMWKDKQGKPQWITVARMLELGEIYVPYDNGWTAFLDIHDMPFFVTQARREYLGPPCVLPGEILASANPHWNGTVHKEVHDDGIRWMSAETSYGNDIADRARRGEKMTLWATYFGANYRYLMEYSFADDGMMTCRVGPTGRNFFSRQDDLKDTHLHVGCWRMEFDLGDPRSGVGGPKDNDVLLVRRVLDEASDRFTQVSKPFAKNGQGEACEGSARWSAEEFTTLRVQSRVRKNSHGRPVAFDLVPHRLGALRQLQPTTGDAETNMDFINYDFWVTRSEPRFTSYVEVPEYASKKRPLSGHPTTVWHCAPSLHVSRGEDFSSADGKSSGGGVATTFWTGFHIKPRDLFDGSPLYQPTPRPDRPAPPVIFD